jgi:endonuclease G
MSFLCCAEARKLLPIASTVLLLLVSGFPCRATIDAALQMQLGNPSNASADPSNHNHYLIQRTVEAIDYSDNLGQPNWVSWDLTASDLGNSGRTDAWASDTNLPPAFYIVPINPFSGSGYDRGHMCPSADRTYNTADNELVFLMSNIIPQASLQNQGIWANFENYCRQTLLPGGKELLIICGPSLFTSNKLNNGHVTVPGYTWKIVVVLPPGTGPATNRISATNQVIAVRIPNADAVGNDSWQNYRTNVVAIENDTVSASSARFRRIWRRCCATRWMARSRLRRSSRGFLRPAARREAAWLSPE